MRHDIPTVEMNTLTVQLHHLHRPASLLEALACLTQALRSNRPTHALLWAGRILFVVLAIANTKILIGILRL